ncbi:hypothetical protein MC885_005801 [Smutsia gigantea]|nr:hypothetical protein MC885_005801 [Smutsia gigantea]
MVGYVIDIILDRRNCMASTLQSITENFHKLLSLNLPSNGLYQLDGLSDIIQMVPTVKILNLSKDEVSRGSQIRVGLQLKSAWQLDKMKGLKLEELWLKRNPLCETFPDQATYIRSAITTVILPGDLLPWEPERP